LGDNMKVLHITSELDGGGIDRLLYDYCIRMSDTVHFDFAICADKKGILESGLENAGSKIYHIARLRGSLFKSMRQLSKILQSEHYDIIHIHSDYKSIVALFVAWFNGVKVRIAHSHIAFAPETIKEKAIRKVITPFTKLFATDLFACGKDAGEWVWGSKAMSKSNFHIMNNAIDARSFTFDEKKRIGIRKELNIENKFVVGNVARFCYQKNHEFLILIFTEIKKLCPDSILLLIGRGELEADVKKLVASKNLTDSVIFLGVRNDVPDLLNAMDVFLLPSRFEGLPVTLVEVQANGLSAFVSDTITNEIKIGHHLNYISLSESPESWAKKLLSQASKTRHIGNCILDTKYDIQTENINLALKYRSLLNCEIS